MDIRQAIGGRISKSDTWTYWDSRFASFPVIFQNNCVTSIEQGVRRTEEKGKKK
jgi:hypothetical protein